MINPGMEAPELVVIIGVALLLSTAIALFAAAVLFGSDSNDDS